MKTFQFRNLIREEVRKALKESDDYGVISNPAAAQLQKTIDAKYRKLFYAIDETPALNRMLDSYMNRTDSFETAEDFKNYNEGLIEVFMTIIKDLKKVNSVL
jgi:hypothetical protein